MTLPHVPTDVAPPPGMFCRTCRRALTTLTGPTGVTFRHAIEARGGTVDHRPDPVPLADITDPILECDFCSAPDAAWLYRCADQVTDVRVITARTVGAGDYQRRHHAARTRSVETAEAPLQVWGERWTACTECADLIEARDLYGLISRVADAMPAKLTRGRRLARIRGHLHANYSTLFATLHPDRDRITGAHTPESETVAPDGTRK